MGELRYGGSCLVRSDSQEHLETSRSVFLALIVFLVGTPEVRQIVQLKSKLAEGVPRLRRLLGDLLLMGLVPGRCSVCRRLGM